MDTGVCLCVRSKRLTFMATKSYAKAITCHSSAITIFVAYFHADFFLIESLEAVTQMLPERPRTVIYGVPVLPKFVAAVSCCWLCAKCLKTENTS